MNEDEAYQVGKEVAKLKAVLWHARGCIAGFVAGTSLRDPGATLREIDVALGYEDADKPVGQTTGLVGE